MPTPPVSPAFAGRVIVQPRRGSESVFEDFQVGAAFTSSDVNESVADLRSPTASGNTFERPEFAVQGSRRRAGVEMRWRPGPFGVQSEWIRLSSERLGQSVDNTDLPPLDASAWYVQGTWLLTGEKKAEGADEPERPLFDGGFGSVELAARVEAIRFSSDGTGLASIGPRADTVLPHQDRALTLGVNWSPNRWVRVQANLVRDTLSEPSASFWSRVVRFRVAM
jgi:phosphate-selective porin